MRSTTSETDLARLLQRFFYQRLQQQQHLSARTVASYRDTFRLLFHFAEQHFGRDISTLCLHDLDASLVLAFLDHLEIHRHNCIRSRNARFAAIRALLHYVALQEPAFLAQVQRVLAIPMKRFERPLVGFLSREEMEAILAAPDAATWTGQRDRLLILLLYNTGARVSELIGIRRGDVDTQHAQAVQLHGKWRKERVVPLWRHTARRLDEWMVTLSTDTTQPILLNRGGRAMSRSGVEQRLQLAVSQAAAHYLSLKDRRVSPHMTRHTTAMHLLQSGVDLAVIALWLGHEQVATTHQYLEADLDMKERALASLQPPETATPRFVPKPDVLAFLDSL
jgi:site-specific recombinase XerD